MISRKTFRIFLILAFLSFTGVLFTQVIWMKRAYSEKKEEFNLQLTLALQEVVRDILRYNNTKTIPANPVNQLTENYYAVMVNDLIDPAVLDHFIKAEFERFNIKEAYAYSIYDCSNKQLVYGGYYKENLKEESLDGYKFPDFELDNYYFTIYFPNIKLGLISEMGLWMYLSGLVLIILIFFTYSFFVITRQKRLSEIQRDFINNMTHEIRTPLTTIGISVNGISSNLQNNPAKIPVFVKIIQDESAKLRMQLERILGIEEGLKLQKDWIEPNKQLSNCLEKFVVLQSFDTSGLSTQFCNEQVQVLFDEFHFSQVCSNLIDNAIKYGGKPIKIEVVTRFAEQHFRIEVRDNGIGIPKKYQKKIFERFFRIPYGNKHEVKGFGIGLFYVRQIVEAHKGKVWVESKEGLGSTFIIELPAKI